jgi:ribokinase
MAVVIFGSINMDLVIRAPRLPASGETITGRDFVTTPGGKGANQAVACARLGAASSLVGRVGGDVFGAALLENLRRSGVNTAGIQVSDGASGVAIIEIDDRGENTIVVAPGANQLVGDADVAQLSQLLGDAKVLLLQLEVPIDAVIAAAKAARAQGAMVILDPAPAREIPAALYQLADIITPNETEAAALVGFQLTSDADIQRAAQVLRKRTGGRVVIKLGARGAYVLGEQGERFVPPFSVTAVDTVAAGDAFNGGLAAALSDGKAFDEALRWGLGTGALAVTRRGAQEAMPTQAELLAFLG